MKTAIFAVVASLLLTGCASPVPLPDVSARKKPTLVKAKPTHYHNVITGYEHREPTAPEPWVTGDAPPPAAEEEPQQ